MQETNEASNEFLSELKSQFDRDMEVRKNLDSKITSMITMSSSVVTVLIGIGTLLVSNIEPKTDVFGISLWILGFGILTAIACIILLIKSYAMRTYTYPMGHERFFKDDEKGEYDYEMIKKFRTASLDKFAQLMIEEYLVSIKNSSKANSNKVKYIKLGQISFLCSMGLIALLLCYVLIEYGSRAISLQF